MRNNQRYAFNSLNFSSGCKWASKWAHSSCKWCPRLKLFAANIIPIKDSLERFINKPPHRTALFVLIGSRETLAHIKNDSNGFLWVLAIKSESVCAGNEGGLRNKNATSKASCHIGADETAKQGNNFYL